MDDEILDRIERLAQQRRLRQDACSRKQKTAFLYGGVRICVRIDPKKIPLN